MLTVTEPMPFAEAVETLVRRRLAPTNLTTAELGRIAAGIRRQSFFSAQLARADVLGRAKALLTRLVNPSAGAEPGDYMDVARFREEMRGFLASIGYRPEEGKAGSLEDLASEARLDLIAKTNAQMAYGWGQHTQAQAPDVLDAFPAQELYRLEDREEPRDWPARWRAAGGAFHGGGRMIARKDWDGWSRLGPFQNPFPPFDFNSGMWVRDIGRAEAVQLGVIGSEDVVQPSPLAAFGPEPGA